MKSDATYRRQKFLRNFCIYALLLGGSIIFVWPFLWMAMTSVKVDREMFAEKIRLWPQRPLPAKRSPYVDTRYYRDVSGKRMDEVIAIIKQELGLSPWGTYVKELDEQMARGVYHRLLMTMPATIWDGPMDNLKREVVNRADRDMCETVFRQIYRHFAIGQLRARSYDLQEDQLIAQANVANSWTIGGTATAKLLQITGDGEPYADLHYDFSKGDTITLSQSFTTSFPVERLYRIQLYARPDDSWHPMTVYVEKLGKKLKAERTWDLSDFNWGVGTWQEPGPDDKTNKIRSWRLLRVVDTGPQYESDPHKINITIEIKRNTVMGAWWAKIRRNYSLALDHIPFWRYVATSCFLIILNMVGTLFSCSLVAYSFARLQWPGRNFCFTLMLATMMIPGQVTMIPYFLIVKSLGWYNTLYPLWVGSFFASAFNVFLLRQFFKGIPRDLEDAAKIDGCGFWRIYWFVMLPLIKPTLAAIAIFTFLGVWNDFMGPLIYLSDQRLYPLSLGLYAFNVQAGGSMGMMMAGSVLMTLPVIFVFFFAQRYFIQGVTLTGMKG